MAKRNVGLFFSLPSHSIIDGTVGFTGGCITKTTESFKHTVQLWLAWCQPSQTSATQADKGMLFVLIAQKRVGNQPGRIEPRAVKRRPKLHPLLMEPREKAKAKIKKHGHPKKIKA